MDGALLIDKPEGLSSFGAIEELQRAFAQGTGAKRKDLPKLGHGGTLDPFATGLLVVCVGRGVKLARYFLTSSKAYAGRMKFGQTTASGDPTNPVTETTERLPESLAQLNHLAAQLGKQPYLQTPPMYSAKKLDGKPLYELARQGIEVDREPKSCRLSDFKFNRFEAGTADFSLRCSSGTYIRTLAQDFARMLDSIGMLESLRRTESGAFALARTLPLKTIADALSKGTPASDLSCWIGFDRLLEGYPSAEANADEVKALEQGRQAVLFNILKRMPPTGETEALLDAEDAFVPIRETESGRLVAIARRDAGAWGLERVFTVA